MRVRAWTVRDSVAVPQSVADVVLADPVRVAALTAVRDGLGPEFWLAAGFVRNPCWDAWFGDGRDWPPADLDVLYFDPADLDPARDQLFEEALALRAPGFEWEVRNQARMHQRNDDPVYDGIAMAMRYWLEHATGVALRLRADGGLDGQTSYGWGDLLDGIYRASDAGRRKPDQLIDRLVNKRMRARWPGVRFLLEPEIFGALETERVA